VTQRRALQIAFAIALAGVAYNAASSFLVVSPLQPEEAVRRIAALQAYVGRPLRAVAVRIDPGIGAIAVLLPNPGVEGATDQWQISHVQDLQFRERSFVDWIHVSGPEGVQTGQAPEPTKDQLIELAQVDFNLVPRIAANAIRRVALAEPAEVTEMVLARPRNAGAPMWTVTVTSPHERAQAFVDVAGSIVGVDLSQTLRASTLDLYQGGRPLLEIAEAIATRFDGKEQIDRVLVGKTRITVDLAGTGSRTEPVIAYFSDINGVRRNDDTEPPPIQTFSQWTPKYRPFAAREVDWSALPRLVAAARKQLGQPDAKVMSVEIRKRAACLPDPALEWTVELRPESGPAGPIVLDSAGRALRPDARDDGTAAVRFMDDLRCAVGPHAAAMEVVLGVGVALRDPRKDRSIVELAYVDHWFDIRAGSPGPGKWRGLPYEDDWLFDLGLVDDDLIERLPALESAGLRALNIPGGRVAAVTIERDRRRPNEHPLIIRMAVTGPDSGVGWISFDTSGKIVR